jgi:hypothetical protein
MDLKWNFGTSSFIILVVGMSQGEADVSYLIRISFSVKL